MINPILENFSPEEEIVNSSVEGQVFDQNKLPIDNAIVQLGSLITSTNQFGLFSFENLSMNEKGTFIIVSKFGFLEGSRRFFPREGKISKVFIEMIATDYQSVFDSSTGGKISIDGTTEVTFPPNSLAYLNGEIFDGEVFATSAYLDPTASATPDRMPGNLQGIRPNPSAMDIQIEEVALQSYGMININLQDVNGAPLNIRQGSTATINMTVPTVLQVSAPDEIPLWSFNEEFGIWVEDGLATKINGQYVGEVSHFSWWNCDAPFPLIELDLTLVDENDNPISAHKVGIDLGNNGNASNYSYSNNDGFISGKVPANLTLLLQISGLCDDIIYSTTIGPFTEDISLGNFTVNSPNVNNTKVTGNIVDCNSFPITNGGIKVEIGNRIYTRRVDDGSFDFFFSPCDGSTDLTVTGLDFDALLESDPIIGMVETVNNTGPIEVCTNSITESLLTITVGDHTYNYFGEGFLVTIDTLPSIAFEYITPNNSGQNITIILIGFGGNTTGNYGDSNLGFFKDLTSSPPYELDRINPVGSLFENFTISEISPNFTGSFSGTAINTLGSIPDTVFVSGSISIIP